MEQVGVNFHLLFIFVTQELKKNLRVTKFYVLKQHCLNFKALNEIIYNTSENHKRGS
jgi:hypothetical protein